MRDVNEDPEYRDLKERVKNKELAAMVWGGVATAAAGGIYLMALVLGATAGPLALAGYAALGIVGLFSGYKAFRTGQDVRFDTEELQARRDATNLARAMGAARSPEEQAIMGHTVIK